MGVRLLLLYVIYQSVITASLGGAILPYSNSVGKVTPLKPKPLQASTGISSITSSPSLICDSKDDSKLLSSAAKEPTSRKFSLPIAITSSSRPLPVPKINSTSIENVKIPERLREKFLEKYKGPVRYTKSDICSPDISLLNKNSFPSSPLKLVDTLPNYSSLEMNKLSPLSSITPLPDFAEEFSTTSGTDGSGTLPLSDTIGKVTPIKPKPLPTSTFSPSSLICDNKSKQKLFSPSTKEPISRGFSSPIAIVSSSRALPVPKIDLPSIENVNMPERFNGNVLAQSKCPAYTNPDIYSSEVFLANNNQISSSPSKLPHTLPTYCPLDISIESSKTNDINLLSSSYKISPFSSLGEVTHTFPDSIGKVIPIKPKSLSTSSVSSSIAVSPSPICDSIDDPKLFSSASKPPIPRKFSSPIAITSSSRPLPVPKINSTSIKNVKMPEKLRENCLAQSKRPASYTNRDIFSPEVSLPNENPFSSSPPKLPDALRTYSPLERHKLSPLPSDKSLPDFTIKSSKISDIDFLSSSFQTSPYSPVSRVTHPCSDSIGKVTPIKPKPLTASNISPSITTSPAPINHSTENSKFVPVAAKRSTFGEFSSPLVLTSSSIPLPVPKINSTSIENVKIPERLKEKFLVQSPVKYSKPDICSTIVSLPNKNPLPPSPSKLPLRTYSPLDIHKLSPIPSFRSLPNLPVESSKTNSMDLLSSSSGTIQYSPLGVVKLPSSDTIGKVTPIKPRPSSTSTVSSSITSLLSPICHNKDNPISFSPSTKIPISRGFSSPIAIMSSSRALPVPKINSIKNDKMFLAQSEEPNARRSTHSPTTSLEMKYPFLLPTSNSLEVNKLSPLPSFKSLPDVSVESLKSSSSDLLCSSSKSGQFLAPISAPLSPRSRICESPSTLEARKSTFSEYLSENPFSSVSSSLSTPYPLFYKSRYLPGVKTSSEPLSNGPFFYKEASNVDLPSHSCSYNLLSPPILPFGNSPNLLSHVKEPYASSYSNSIRSLQIPKPINPIQIPKPSTNIPISSHIVNLAQDVVTNNVCLPNEVNTVSVAEAIKPKLEPKSASSSPIFRTDQNLRDDKTIFKLRPCSPLKINPVPFTTPSSYFNSPAPPLMPISISSPNVVLSNKMSSSDFSKSITPEIFPVIGICTETIEKMDPNNLGNYQTSVDYKNIPNLELINQYTPFTKEGASRPIKYSPPVIPKEPIPIIFSSTPTFSHIAYCPSSITQTPTNPVSYINQSKTSSIADTTSNMVSSIRNLLSNITQNALTSFQPSIHSALQNEHQTQTYTIQTNPYSDTLLNPEQPSPVLTNPDCDMSISVLPIITAPLDNKNAQTPDLSTTVPLDTPSAFTVSPNHPLHTSSPQLKVPVLSPKSLTTFSTPIFCPSCLPSPILHSYPAIASPFSMEAPAYQTSSSKKDSDVENSIDLMLLTEILNNDESFDWDDLDELLAFLSLN